MLTAQLTPLAAAAKAKRAAGARTEAEFAAELKEVDALLAAHAAVPAEAAQIAMLRAEFWHKLLGQPDRGIALYQQVKTDYPGTPSAKEVDEIVAGIIKVEAKKKLETAFTIGAHFPAFAEPDITGQQLTPAGRGGKVVLVDFWAMWCSDCMEALPAILATYEKYHTQGLDIVGVSLDKEEDRAKFAPFLKAKGITWPQHFDGQFWENKIARQVGVHRLPTNYLLDRDGVIIGRDLEDAALSAAVAAALKK
jgi:thiol-disulfide isomerase/thioredoxin